MITRPRKNDEPEIEHDFFPLLDDDKTLLHSPHSKTRHRQIYNYKYLNQNNLSSRVEIVYTSKLRKSVTICNLV
jgi:hypothetical protein